jgi:hypothetical protein
VKDCNTYLPSDEEAAAMIAQAQEAAKSREPSPSDKKDLSAAELNTARAAQIAAEVSGEDAASQANFMAMASGKFTDYGH